MSETKLLVVSEELHKQLKVESAKRGQSIRELTEHALRAYLRELHKKTFVDTKEVYHA